MIKKQRLLLIITIKQGVINMNIKKIGLTALAGSLVATSAFAGSLSVSGGASFEVQHVNGGAANAGKAWSMGNSVTFTGSGELDNGLTASVSFEDPRLPSASNRPVLSSQIKREYRLPPRCCLANDKMPGHPHGGRGSFLE